MYAGTPAGLRNIGAVTRTRRGTPFAAGDHDGDGDDELVFSAGDGPVALWVTDGSKVLAEFDTSRWGS
ncbi:MAG: hypothetical protein HOW71_40400 [Nonomuraea sp.]|nr:hypothetical protein [Nonomuraea sp.]